MEEKESWFKRVSRTNRFWGIVSIAIGTLLMPTPFAAASPYLLTGGFTQLGVGIVNKAKQNAEEKKQGSSDQK